MIDIARNVREVDNDDVQIYEGQHEAGFRAEAVALHQKRIEALSRKVGAEDAADELDEPFPGVPQLGSAPRAPTPATAGACRGGGSAPARSSASAMVAQPGGSPIKLPCRPLGPLANHAMFSSFSEPFLD